MPAVPGIDVLHHLLAPLVLEVDIDVRRLVAFPGDESLEQHVHARGVDFGDAERVAHHGVRRRAAPLAEDRLAAGEAHQVVDGEEIGLVAELGDERKFVLEQFENLLRRAARIALHETRRRERSQVRNRRLARRDQFLRIFVAQLIERESAAPGHCQRLGERFGRKDARQLLAAPQVAFTIRREREPASATRVPRRIAARCRRARARRDARTRPPRRGRPWRAAQSRTSVARERSSVPACSSSSIHIRPRKFSARTAASACGISAPGASSARQPGTPAATSSRANA